MGLTQIMTGGVDENINIDSNTLKVDGTNNRVGIGTATPDFHLDVNGNVALTEGQVLAWHDGSGNKAGDIYIDSSDNIVFRQTSSVNERLRIDSSGRLLVGTNTATKNADRLVGNAFALADAGAAAYPSVVVTGYSNSNADAGPIIDLQKSRGASDGSMTVVANNDRLGSLNFLGSDGTNFLRAADIKAEVDGTPGTNDMPGRLVFATTNDDALSPTERMRIDSSGRVGIGTNSPGSYSTSADELVVAGTTNPGITIAGTSGNTGTIMFADGTSGSEVYRGQIDYQHGSDAMVFFTNGGSERMRIDSSGRMLSGLSSAPGTVGGFSHVNIGGTSINANGAIGLYRNTASPSSGQGIGAISFANSEGNRGALIQALSGGTWGTDDYPGELAFSTTADGASSVSERVRIKSNGNVGVGTNNAQAKLEIGGIPNSGATNEVFTIDRSDGTQLYSINYNQTTNTVEFQGNNKFFAFQNKASQGESMRLESSGRLLVGTTSELLSGDEKKLQITHADAGAEIILGRDDSSVASGNSLGAIKFVGNDGGTYHRCAQIEAIADGSHSNTGKATNLKFSVTRGSATTPTERLKIESEGRSMFFAEEAVTYIKSNASAGTTHALITGVHGGDSVSLRVWTNGNIQNTNNSYGSLSDSKLKENIVDANNQWDDIKGIRVRNYNFIEGQTHTQLGVVAQEVETVSPGLVYETPDVDDDGTDLGTVTKSVNYSVLYMKAVKALQEAMDRIETLETKVAALEAAE